MLMDAAPEKAKDGPRGGATFGKKPLYRGVKGSVENRHDEAAETKPE
jgi:hypothetical protein